MPVRAHERHQASRGGLKGSDASGWTLLAVGKKFRGPRPIGREFRSLRRHPRKLEHHGNRSTRGAAGSTGTAFVAHIVRVTGCVVVLPVRLMRAPTVMVSVVVRI